MADDLCAICAHKPVVTEYKPFCSKRCADIDLAHWLGEKYAVPAETLPTPGAEDGEEDA